MSSALKQQRQPAGGGAKQLAMIGVFLAVLAAVLFLRAHKPLVDTNYGFRLEEVSQACGIDFTRASTESIRPDDSGWSMK